jgi:predicted phosphodiesterase
VVFGDSGADTLEQKEVAAMTHKLDPSLVFHTGDIVYSRGLVSEYRTKHFPIYNADTTGPSIGAPLIRSTLMVAAAGNHDLATRDIGTYPDALPYFYYWQQPLNGPEMPMFARLTGDPARIADFRAAAGANFSRMVNYSFDWGNSHWLALDSNNYVDWSDPAFQKWVDDDLANSKATWKFVGFHHPGFNSSKAHFEDQQARLMAPIFEKRGVDIVFSGHVHNYQRTFPLEYKPEKFDLTKSRVVNGKWELDRAFDGASNMKPKGVIYIVTGAGGNRLYNPEQEDDSRSWQEFTVRFVSKIHSLTELHIDGKRAVFLQRDRAGNVIDHFTISK